jgi:hypothetical protein
VGSLAADDFTLVGLLGFVLDECPWLDRTAAIPRYQLAGLGRDQHP